MLIICNGLLVIEPYGTQRFLFFSDPKVRLQGECHHFYFIGAMQYLHVRIIWSMCGASLSVSTVITDRAVEPNSRSDITIWWLRCCSAGSRKKDSEKILKKLGISPKHKQEKGKGLDTAINPQDTILV